MPLTAKVFDLLLAFVETPGRLLTKEDLIEAVWNDRFVEEGNLARNVSSLRKALNDTGKEHKYIATVQGLGYRFIPDAVLEQPPRRMPGQDEEPPPASFRRWVLIAAAVIIAGFVILSFAFLKVPTSGGTDLFTKPLTFRRLTTSGTVRKLALSPDGNMIAFASGDKTGDKLFVRQTDVSNEIALTNIIGVISSISFSPDGKLIYYSVFRGDSSEGELYSIPTLGGVSRSYPGLGVTDFALAPDGTHFAGISTSRDRGESVLVVEDLTNAGERELIRRKYPTDFGAEDRKVAWAPNGKSIAVVVNEKIATPHFSTLVLVNPETGNERPFTPFNWAHIDSIQWVSDSGGLIIAASEAAGEPSQLYNVALDGTVRRFTNDVNSYSLAAANVAARTVVALQTVRTSGIWKWRPERGFTVSDELTSGSGVLAPLAFAGRDIVFRSSGIGGSDLWSVPVAGGEKHSISQDAKVDFRGICSMPDGSVVFSSDRGGKNNIWRLDRAIGSLNQLTFGENEIYPACTADGRWVIFQRMASLGQKTHLCKVAMNGGEPEPLTDFLAVRPSVSPDGKLIAFFYMDDPVWKIGLMSIAGGQILKTFDLPAGMTDRIARWSQDGRSLLLAGNTGDIGNVWRLPLDGTPSSRITNFDQQNIEDMIVLPSGDMILSRSTTISDVFIASNK